MNYSYFPNLGSWKIKGPGDSSGTWNVALHKAVRYATVKCFDLASCL